MWGHQSQQGTQGLNPPEELGDSEPEDVTDDKAEGPQEEGGAGDLPDGPQQRAPPAPFPLEEGLGLGGVPAVAQASFPSQCGPLGVPAGRGAPALGPCNRLNARPQIYTVKS